MIFRHKVFKILLFNRKITQDLIDLLMNGAILLLTFVVAQESTSRKKRPWRTWSGILSELLSARSA
jgi:hypothetical protein